MNKYTEQIDSTKRLCYCYPRFRFGCSKHDTFCALFAKTRTKGHLANIASGMLLQPDNPLNVLVVI